MNKTTRFPSIFFIVAFFLSILALDGMAQFYGTNRRVARRTSRRTARRVSYRNDYYGYGAAAPITTLPSGCVARAITGINYHYCNGTYYRAYYEGEEIIYVEENP